MEYWWRYGDGPGRSEPFPDQAAAEAWLGTAWPDLRDEGVDAVTLLAGEDEVYGPMSLHAAE